MNNRRQSSFANLNAPDWLWYFLKRVPPEKALLRAMEARFVEQAHLGQPCLDLRNEYGEHQALPPRSADLSASAVLIGTGDATPSFETLREISQRMRTSGKLLVTVPATDLTDESAATWTKLLNQAGFHIDRWHPFYDDSAQDASSAEAHNWSDVLYELTGHHALPWIRILNPIHTVLRPHYENRTSTEGNCLFILASKAEQTPVQQTLPAASPWQVIDEQTKALTAHHLQGDDATASQTVRQANTPVSYLPARRFFPSSKLFLSALAFGATMLAQLSMRSTPDRMGSGVVWLILALGAIFGLSRSSAETNSNFQQTLSKWVRTLPFTQITTVSASIVVSAIAYAQAERPMIALPLWLIAIISTGTTLFRFTSDVPPNTTNDEPSKLDNDEASTIYSRLASLKGYILPLILFVALFLRVYQLTAHPWVINGAEAQLGLDAIYTQNVFGTAWLSNPTLPLFLTKLTVAIFGRTPLALRLFAPLIGTATVYAIYQVGKRLWDEKVGLVAAILL
ncbi:MAG: ArnT family glycosyltransferase, partial [Candidatus Promineifilaceae bacterium]